MNLLFNIARRLNQFSMLVVAGTAVVCLCYTLLCVAGVFPWFQYEATFGETVFANAGQYAQIGLTVLLILFGSFLPTAGRVSLLEGSHRKFHLKMEDVAQAYFHCHAADREGVFNLSSEFDSVRERLAYLREHPKLGNLEPDVLEIASQMSHQAKDLAAIYSDENVLRAKQFLRQRQEEISERKSQIETALKDCREIEEWVEFVEEDEKETSTKIADFEERMKRVLPQLGIDIFSSGNNVLPMAHTAAE